MARKDDPAEATFNFYVDNGYLKREKPETGKQRAQRIEMTLWGSQNFADGGAVPGYAGGDYVRVLKQLANKAGKFQAQRAERTADSIDTSKFDLRSFEKMFSGPGTGLLTTMPPSSFEDYARPLKPITREQNPYPRWDNVPRRAVPKKPGEATFDAYLDNIGNLINTRGMPEPPTLWLAPPTPSRTGGLGEIEGHEGRHRMRALDRMGEKEALVRLAPANAGDARGTAEEAYERMMGKYFPEGGSDRYWPELGDRDALPFPNVPFAGGGEAVEGLQKLLGKLRAKGSGYEAPKGTPSIMKIPGIGEVEPRPLPEMVRAAEDYMRRRGGTYDPLTYTPINPDFGRAVANTYDRLPNAPNDPRVRRAYDALIDETMDQYRALKDTGYDFKFHTPTSGDPYARSPSLGYADLVNNGKLHVFPTLEGFGSGVGDSSFNPLLKGVGRVGDLSNATANDAFRIVHDMYGHFGPGNPFFRAPGEERAYQLHSRMYGPEARQAAATETRGQNSWVNYGPFSGKNRGASGADTVYAPQTVNLLPDWAQSVDSMWPIEKADGGLLGGSI
ncbi:MAG: hypothetical protein WC829_05840 [Hyphomicrobium sp.]|jgi:hypothetical protein